MSLALAVKRSRRRTHEDATVPISLDAVWKIGEKGIGQNFLPTSQVRPGLRLKIW